MSGESHVTYRVDDVAAALVGRLGSMETMKLQKLLYYAQAWHLAATDEPLFADAVEAWKDGPVVPEVWRAHKRSFKVHNWPEGDPAAVRGSAAAVLEVVAELYGNLSGDDLSRLTHDELPWRAARGGLPEGARSSQSISLAVMRDFYREQPVAGVVLPQVADALGGSETLTVEQSRGLVEATMREMGFEPKAPEEPVVDDGGAQQGRLVRGRPDRVVSYS